ncbi:MAG TPA: hypothetical protein VMV31_03630 [Terriglobales bacterium]|nr:hypothetical protein [Terriglobales bacterium]
MGGEWDCRASGRKAPAPKWLGRLGAVAAVGLGLGWGLAARGQRLNPPERAAPVIAPMANAPRQAAAAQPPGPASGVAVMAFRQERAAPPPPDPIIAGHDLRVGVFYYIRHDWVGALSRFQDAIYNDPHAPEAYCRAGDSEWKLKHALRAQDDWQRCLKVAGEGKWANHARKALAKQKRSQS